MLSWKFYWNGDIACVCVCFHTYIKTDCLVKKTFWGLKGEGQGLSGKDFLELKFEQASDKSKGYKSKSLFDSWMKQMVNSKIDVCLVYFRYKNGWEWKGSVGRGGQTWDFILHRSHCKGFFFVFFGGGLRERDPTSLYPSAASGSFPQILCPQTDRGWEPETQSKFPTWVSGTQGFRPASLPPGNCINSKLVCKLEPGI